MIALAALAGLVGQPLIYQSLQTLGERAVQDDYQISVTAPLQVSGANPSGAPSVNVIGGTVILRNGSATIGLYLPDDPTKFLAGDGTWETPAGSSPLTTKGDLWGYSTMDDRVPIGTNGYVLTADSTQALGVKWAAAAGTGTVTSIGSAPGITLTPDPIVGVGTVGLTIPVTPGHGGSGTTTVFTAGSIVFAGPSGVYAQDNTKLFYDDTNNRVGLNTTSPNELLDVRGKMRAGDDSQNNYPVDSPIFYFATATSNVVGNWTATNAGGNGAQFTMRADGGGAGQKMNASDWLGVIGFRGKDDVGFAASSSARILAAATEVWSSTAHGTKLQFGTTINASTALATALEIDNDGFTRVMGQTGTSSYGLRFATTTPADKWHIQYGSGALGVTQTGVAQRVWFADGGNVGVAMSPARLLDVSNVGFIRGKIQDYGGQWHNVLAYGAVADAESGFDGTINNGSTTFTSAGANFLAYGIVGSNPGTPISITGAAAAGATLYTTIVNINSATSVTLANSNASGSNLTTAPWSAGTDNTAAFVAAITAAQTYPDTKFGTVYAPRGLYRISTHFTVSARVMLLGESTVPLNGVGGTQLHLVEGAGSASGTAGVTIDETASVSRVTFVRPNQPITGNPLAFPFDVALKAFGGVTDCGFYGGYQGIDAASASTGSLESNFTIRGITGDLAFIGIDVDQSYDTSHIANVHLFPFWTQDATRMSWKHSNAISVRFGRADWIVVENFFSYGMGTGFQFNHSTAGGAGTSGCFTDIQFDATKYGIDATETGYQGVQFANLTCGGGGAGLDAYGIRTNYNASYKCNIAVAGFQAWGTTLWGVYHDSLGHVAVTNGQFIQQTGNGSYQGVYVGRDSAVIEGCQFRFDTAAYVALQSDTNATNVRFNNNILNGCTLTISNSKTTLDGSFPWPAASAYNSAAQSIANATPVAMTFNTNLYDNGVHSTSSNPTRFTAPTGLGTGLFSFVGTMTFATLAGGNNRQVQLWKNGATQVGQTTFPFANNVATLSLEIAWQGQLAPGDYLEMYAYQDSGGAANTVAGEPNCRGSLTRLS